MKNICAKKLSTWKTIIVTDLPTGETKNFELNEKERLINKVKSDRQKHIPKACTKIKFTKQFVQKHQELEIVLNKMIASYPKNQKKKEPSIMPNNDEISLFEYEETLGLNEGERYKDLMDQFFMNPETYDFDQDTEFIPQDEFNFF